MRARRNGPGALVALSDMDETLAVVEIAKRHFRNLAIFAGARNRRHAHLLMDVGITGIIRETFFSSLRLTEMVLEELGIPPETAHDSLSCSANTTNAIWWQRTPSRVTSSN